MKNATNAKRGGAVVRFPPSPTGKLHIGGARTALFNYLFARTCGGKLYLRLEDTDRERSKAEFERNILEGLAWLGIDFDALPDGSALWRQSERSDLYRERLSRLIAAGTAYVSEEQGGERRGVIRFRNPGHTVTFDDLIRGPISFDTKELGDFVIARSLDEPVYHFAAVVDDAAMGVTDVIRGEDHISNTPRQILLLEALGFPRPAYAHIPLILAPDRSKLSKRHGAVALTEYRDGGYLPEAMVNYLALLGWNPGTDEELFTMKELAAAFDLSRVQRGPAVFNKKKLDWINRQWLKRMPRDAFREQLAAELKKAGVALPGDMLARLAPTLHERLVRFGELGEMAREGEFSYFIAAPQLDRTKIPWRGSTPEATKRHMHALSGILSGMKGQFDVCSLQAAVLGYAEAQGRGDVLWPFRYALSGRERSPDPFTLAAILGREESIKRLRLAVKSLS